MDRSGCKIMLGLKAFSMHAMYPLIGQFLSGTAASDLYEAKLGYEGMGKENQVFPPAYWKFHIIEETQLYFILTV